jgi:hypothetical protein
MADDNKQRRTHRELEPGVALILAVVDLDGVHAGGQRQRRALCCKGVPACARSALGDQGATYVTHMMGTAS